MQVLPEVPCISCNKADLTGIDASQFQSDGFCSLVYGMSQSSSSPCHCHNDGVMLHMTFHIWFIHV